ncbi:Protein F19G12.2 [Aphelenchoides avenae]|nr:Protein F19G12.2 [Aphelenchus avenae]
MSAMKKIDAKSENAVHSALNIFGVPPTNVSVDHSQVREILPLNAIEETSTYEFRIFSDNQWLDLSKTYLYLQLQLQKYDNGVWVPLDVNDQNVAPVQAIGNSFVRQLKMYVNSTEVYDSTALYPYISYLKNELNYSTDVKDTWLMASGYYREDKIDDTDGKGFKSRVEVMGHGQICEFETRLDFDLANQGLYLLNNLDVLFTIYKNDDKFLVHNLSAVQNVPLRVKVHNIRLRVKSVDVQPSLNLSVMNMLEKTTAKYPMRRTEIRSSFITAGRTEYTYNVFTNVIPRRLVVAMVDNQAFKGDYMKDPYNFQPFDLNEIQVNAGGLVYPTVAYRMNWSPQPGRPVTFLRPYMDMMDATMASPNLTNGISPVMFMAGWTMFVIPLTSTLEDTEGFELIKNGTTTIHLRFNTALQRGVELVILGEFDQVLSIDQNRVPVGDGEV